MKAARAVGSFFSAFRSPRRKPAPPASLFDAAPRPKIGLALGGGFARGIAHAGVLDVFEQHGIPIHCITGCSTATAGTTSSGRSRSPSARLA